MDLCSDEQGDALAKLTRANEIITSEKLDKLSIASSSDGYGSNASVVDSEERDVPCFKVKFSEKKMQSGYTNFNNEVDEIDGKNVEKLTDSPLFPTTFTEQFNILFKRSIRTICREKMLTQMRIISHVFVAVMIAMLYHDIGEEATKIRRNVNCVFFVILFTMFASMMPTVSLSVYSSSL